MKHCINKDSNSSIDQLKDTIVQVRNELSFDMINKLVDSMEKRMLKVIEKKGETVFLNEID